MALVTVSPIGDVLISLAQKEKPPIRFLVSSAILCTASPVFSAMLGPSSSFSEAASLRQSQSTGGDPYVQTLSDDDPVALAVILNAIHLQASKVPRKVTFSQLMKLAILCDKYDCVYSLKLWVDLWMKPWRFKEINTRAMPDEWLFIAWVFEANDEFAALTKMYISKTAYSHSGSDEKKRFPAWTVREGTNESWSPSAFHLYTPDAIIDAMLKQRESIIRAILDICRVSFSKYTSNHPQCRHSSKDDKCDSLILGSLYKAFTRIGILSFDFNSVDSRSLEQLVHELRGIKINHLDYDLWEQFSGCKKIEHSKTCDPMKQILFDVAAQVKRVTPLSLKSFKGKTKAKEGEEGMLWEMWEKEVGVVVCPS